MPLMAELRAPSASRREAQLVAVIRNVVSRLSTVRIAAHEPSNETPRTRELAQISVAAVEPQLDGEYLVSFFVANADEFEEGQRPDVRVPKSPLDSRDAGSLDASQNCDSNSESKKGKLASYRVRCRAVSEPSPLSMSLYPSGLRERDLALASLNRG